MQLTLRAHF
uniref:Uncharacterized protein n=1 Tax=Anguilla anguilla TaxID=7936 RepID=A0A0E9W1S8_ANGAN